MMTASSRSSVWTLAAASALVCLVATPALARKRKPDDGLPDKKAVAEQVRAVFEELATSSDPRVRMTVYEGRLALGGADARKAIEDGLKDGEWTVRERAFVAALADRKLRSKAVKALGKLLASVEPDDRDHAYPIAEKNLKARDREKLYKVAAKDSDPDGRSRARDALIAMGGRTGWKIIAAGLAEDEGSREYKQAFAALSAFEGKEAVKWALGNIHAKDATGDAARAFLVRTKQKGVGRSVSKIYDKKGAEYAARLDAASVLAQRGEWSKVLRTLLAGLSARVRDAHMRRMAWQGMLGVRDLGVLGKLRNRILNGDDGTELDRAFAWLEAWATDNGEKKVFEVLQEGARSDRQLVRSRALATLTRLKHRPSAPIFESALSEGLREMRLAGAEGLAAVAQSKDIPAISQALRREPDVEVKRALVQALATIGTPDIIAPLQFVVTTPDPVVKRAAVDALAGTGKPKAATLLKLLKQERDVDLRFHIWRTLLRLDPGPTVKEFRTVLTWMSATHASALAEDDGVPLDVYLLIAEKGRDDLRGFGVEGLKRRGEKAATRLLSLAERSPNADTAAGALAALAEIRADKSIPTYRKALEHDEGAVRAAGLGAIADYGKRPLLETVLPALADKDPMARAEAATAAVRIVDRHVE